MDVDQYMLMQATIKRVVPYIEMEEFHPENVAKVSKACKSICQWVRAMYVYHNVALQVLSPLPGCTYNCCACSLKSATALLHSKNLLSTCSASMQGLLLQVEPKRQALAGAQADLDKTNQTLAKAQAQLAAVQEKIASLEAAFGEAMDKKAALAKQVADCTAKLQRADKLIGGLGGERVLF